MRVVNRHRATFTHYIGRGSVFGNPFTHLPVQDTKAAVQVDSREEAVQAYEDWLCGNGWTDFMQDERADIIGAIQRLPVNAVLGCYCSPAPCHGDVIVKLYPAYELA